MKKILISLLLFLCSLFAINYNCKVFADLDLSQDLTSLSQLNIINENTIYGVDNLNNKIVKIINNQTTTFGEYGNLDGQFTEIKFFKVLSNNELLVMDSLNRLQFFDTNFNHIKTIQYVLNNNQYSLIGNINSVCCDIYANVYLLDSSNNYVIKANSHETYAQIFQKDILNDIKIINFNINGNLVFANENTIFNNNLSQTLEENIEEIFTDALNYIYIKTPLTIYKYNSNLVKISSIELPQNCTNLSINLEEGVFYYLNSSTSDILKIENFATDVSNFTAPYSIKDGAVLTEKIKFAKVSKDCYLYSTPYQISSSISLNNTFEIIVLKENFDENLFFSYVLLVHEDKVTTGYIKSDCYEISNATLEQIAIPIRKDIPYFKLPLKIYDETSLKLGTLESTQTYQTTQKITFNNVEFFEIKLEDNYVFVESKNVLENTSNFINTYFMPDAVVKTINDEKSVNIYEDENKTTVSFTVETPLNVKMVKKIDTLYEIQFLIDNEIKTGYVESANLFKNKNSFITPIVIVLVVLCLIIILIILFKFKKEFKRNI